ncbi:unnamed protein product [Laminaria digitata]
MASYIRKSEVQRVHATRCCKKKEEVIVCGFAVSACRIAISPARQRLGISVDYVMLPVVLYICTRVKKVNISVNVPVLRHSQPDKSSAVATSSELQRFQYI